MFISMGSSSGAAASLYVCMLPVLALCNLTTRPTVWQLFSSVHLQNLHQMKCIEDAPGAWHQWALSATWINLRKLPYVILWDRIPFWDNLCSGTCTSWTVSQWKFKKWDCAFFFILLKIGFFSYNISWLYFPLPLFLPSPTTQIECLSFSLKNRRASMEVIIKWDEIKIKRGTTETNTLEL